MQSTDANTEMTNVSGLSGKDFKAVIIKMLQVVIINTLGTNEKLKSLSKKYNI